MKKYFKLFANCIIVKGSHRSIICDLQRMNFDFIPNDLFEILNIESNSSLNQIIKKYGVENEKTILEYFNFLENREFVFYINKLSLSNNFPKLSLDWDTPSQISNLIIDFNKSSDFTDMVFKIFDYCDEMLCENLQIRIFDYPPNLINNLTEYSNKFRSSSYESIIRNIELFVPYNSEISLAQYHYLLNKNYRIMKLIIHSSPFNNTVNSMNDSDTKIIYSTSKIENVFYCGSISSKYFTVNMNLFTEAQKHNTCLNRKLSIDVNGEIKNCPSMAKSYGNIKDTTLQEAIEKPGFKDMWYINKDQVNICKDCEFRYICTDCRAYIESPEDIYSKPLKCGYNPYTTEWEEWSTNPLKQKAIEHYGMQELVKGS